MALALPEGAGLDAAAATRTVVEGALLGDYDPDTYRSDRKDQSVQAFTLVAPATASAEEKKALEAAFGEGVIVGDSQNLARELVNEPGNKLTPTVLGKALQRRWPRKWG